MLQAVKDGKGNAILWDIFLGDKWFGSRRTFQQAFHDLNKLLK